MKKTLIKICGLRWAKDAELINPYPEIAYAGLVFADSRRRIDIKIALEIKSALRDDIKTVAVFADNSLDEIRSVVAEVKPDIIQLHSDEDNNFILALGGKVWKSVSIKDRKSIEKIADFTAADGIVLDTYSPLERGGTGKAFDRTLLKGLNYNGMLILAGGINKDNINQSIRELSPDVIDLSSSVETDGYKDGLKIKELIEEFRKEDRNGAQ